MKSLDDGSAIFLLLYVGNMLIIAKSMSEVNKLKILLIIEFDMKDLGATKRFLGWRLIETELSGDCGCLRVAMLGRCWRRSTWRMQNQ